MPGLRAPCWPKAIGGEADNALVTIPKACQQPRGCMLSESASEENPWILFVLQSMRKRRVLFKTSTMSQSQKATSEQPQSSTSAQPSPSDRLDELLSGSSRLEEITTDDEFEDMDEESPKGEVIPDLVDLSIEQTVAPLFTSLPPLVDPLKTKTSEDQRETVEKILPFHNGNPFKLKLNSHGVPHLLREHHLAYAVDGLSDYPAPFVAMDASRPWIPYWSLFAISVLGQDTSEFREG